MELIPSSRRPPESSSRETSSRPQRNSTLGHSVSRTTSSTPHPQGLLHHAPLRPSTSASQLTFTSYSGSRSATSLSHSNPSRQRRHTSTTSGRKSRAASSVWGSESHEIICAVTEARGVSPTVGLAFINITTDEAILSQICDSQFYVKTVHKIQMYEPSTILMVKTAFPPHPKSSLLSIIEEELPDTTIEPLDRRYWSENAGLEFIQNLAFREDLEAIKVAIEGNFYATCSFAAVIKYVELSCRVSIASHSLRVSYRPSENTMMIDISTIHSLELIQNLQNAKSKDCLFGLLNETLTPMGSRMLRSNILQPSCQVDNTLAPRYDALDELTAKEDMFFEIRKALKGFVDMEKLLTSLVIVPEQSSIYISEQAINNILGVKTFITAVPTLYEALGAARTDLLTRIRGICRPELTQPVADLIADTINEDVTATKSALDMRNQRTYAVKSGVHGLLDVARQTYKEATDDVYQHVEDINRDHDVTAEVRYDPNRKFWLRLRQSDFEDKDIPEILINKVLKGTWIECQTLVLVQLNHRITDSSNEAIMLSDKVVQELLDAIRTHVPNLFRVCESIALLDMIAAFGQSAMTRDYVRPEIGSALALKGARHPICERINPERFVPNDVFANEQHRFQIITGCNMSGKSTYIRMIPLLQVMAQIGCFVPAQYAVFPVIQQLFVRMSTDDSIEANMSTFSLEMREMAFILRNINGKSLAIIDELGRGTSTRDGLAIALAISEALIQSDSLVWFATHFQQLAKVLGSRPGVLNLHLATETQDMDEGNPKMTMLYKITSGPVEEEHYGLSLARAIGFPERFVEVADNVSKTLTETIERKKQDSQSRKLLRRRKLILNLHDTLLQLRESDMDDAALGSYLKRLQDEFVSRMDEIERDRPTDEESL
ncbi:DNA mismatch repair protein-like protein MutS [Annulohypoxylon truncatum]|uniref:DNA mismatch repair protein-like protein MutS n=1 Tax=Annulohypoxylon truncatum TaxID=327061 RepID=UPI0020082E61|nr:DNA mismatch repair protein-like protein MutS [Annulohypoxylon truncatum]KAI1208023.1 DNA mismatch repair protein-like protein MutS [Annulohypoxylon truncatum]